MTSMIERVALAFAGLHITTASGSVVDENDVAYAAIEAMLSPTEAMCIAGDKALESTGEVLFIWQAMITAALNEEQSHD